MEFQRRVHHTAAPAASTASGRNRKLEYAIRFICEPVSTSVRGVLSGTRMLIRLSSSTTQLAEFSKSVALPGHLLERVVRDQVGRAEQHHAIGIRVRWWRRGAGCRLSAGTRGAGVDGQRQRQRALGVRRLLLNLTGVGVAPARARRLSQLHDARAGPAGAGAVMLVVSGKNVTARRSWVMGLVPYWLTTTTRGSWGSLGRIDHDVATEGDLVVLQDARSGPSSSWARSGSATGPRPGHRRSASRALPAGTGSSDRR